MEIEYNMCMVDRLNTISLERHQRGSFRVFGLSTTSTVAFFI